MIFRDFDIAFEEAQFPEARRLIDVSRAFVESIVTELRRGRVDAPWIKLYVGVRASLAEPYFEAATPKLGLSAAGAWIRATDPRLLTATGEAVRPVLAEAILAARPTIQEASDWDDPWFWELVDRVGSHKGPYQQRLKHVADRANGRVYHLTFEWDEAGTKLYIDARETPGGGALLGRVQLGDYPDQWELFTGRVPTRLRLAGTGIDLLDEDGIVRTIERGSLT